MSIRLEGIWNFPNDELASEGESGRQTLGAGARTAGFPQGASIAAGPFYSRGRIETIPKARSDSIVAQGAERKVRWAMEKMPWCC